MSAFLKFVSFIIYSFVLYLSYRQGNLVYTACISLLSVLVYSLFILEKRILVQNIEYTFTPGEGFGEEEFGKMTLNEYQEKAKVTDVRPAQYKMICNGFGLLGEQAELDEAIAILEDEESMIKELGDVLWYSASICTEFNVSLDSVFHKFPKEFDEKPVAEVFKKVYRDKDGVFDAEDKERILAHIHNILNFYSGHADIFEAAEKNITKLYSRLERGKIQGNGNNR